MVNISLTDTLQPIGCFQMNMSTCFMQDLRHCSLAAPSIPIARSNCYFPFHKKMLPLELCLPNPFSNKNQAVSMIYVMMVSAFAGML